MAEELNTISSYNDDNIVHLDDREHIRRRPGMYIGKLGDGKHDDDGIYVLIKETIDNSIDEFRMNEGKVIEVTVRPYTDDEGYTARSSRRSVPWHAPRCWRWPRQRGATTSSPRP